MKKSMMFKNEYVFSILTRFVSVFLSLVQSVLIARYLGAELQGVSSYISSITNIGAIVITFGMHQAYAYFRKKLGKEKIFEDYMSLMILLYSLLTCAGILCYFVGSFSIELRAAIMMIPIFGYSKVVSYVCLIESPNIRNLWWTASGACEILLLLILWLATMRGFVWLLVILLFAEVFKIVVYTSYLKPRVRIHKGLLGLAAELGKFGFFPMLALLMTTLNYRIDILMLRQYPYITDAMIGVYSVGIHIAERIIMIPDTLKGVLVSKLSKGGREREVADVCRFSIWASFMMCFLFLILGQPVIDLLYGTEYKGAYNALLISSFGTIAISYFKLIAQYNIVNRKQILNVLMLSVAIITDIVLNLTFIPVWGVNGAALATGIGNFVCGIVFAVWFCRKTGIAASVMIIPQKQDLAILKKLFIRKS